MSKVSFRARQIDFNKPLPILKHGSELFLEISENALVNRGVPQIPSGMEKEEENEHHFLEVIQALQRRGDTTVRIPVPDIIDKDGEYQDIYSDGFVLPKQLIHIRTIVFADQEPVEYDMDSEDEEWLHQNDLGIGPEKFESMIDRLERGCGQKVMNLEEAKYLLHDHPSLVIAVYDYWLNKRVQSRQPLLYAVRQERRDNSSNTDPYVAFRRRSEKMQTRKNRKNDEQSYEKMLILREQMDTLGEILGRLVKREAMKESFVDCDYECFQLRCKLGDWDGSQIMEAENLVRKYQTDPSATAGMKCVKENKKRPIRKRKVPRRPYTFQQTASSDDSSEMEPENTSEDGPFAFTRSPGCRYLKPRPLNECNDPVYPHSCYRLTTVPSICHSRRHMYTGYIRRRVGRGGRIIYDRIPPPPSLELYLESCDKDTQASDAVCTEIDAFRTVLQSRSGVCWRHSQTKDMLLTDRLKSVILSSHHGRPQFPWPTCTKFPSSFEPLLMDPQPLRSSCPCFPSVDKFGKSEEKAILETDADSNLSFASSDSQNTSQKLSVHSFNSAKSTNTAPLVTPPINPSICERNLANQMSKTGNLIPTPQRLWRKLARSYGSIDFALQPSEFPRPRVADISNGIAPPPDNQLLLTDPSVVPPHKMRCLVRDCATRDNKVPGPQLQTANGVSPTQIFQLPT